MDYIADVVLHFPFNHYVENSNNNYNIMRILTLLSGIILEDISRVFYDLWDMTYVLYNDALFYIDQCMNIII